MWVALAAQEGSFGEERPDRQLRDLRYDDCRDRKHQPEVNRSADPDSDYRHDPRCDSIFEGTCPRATRRFGELYKTKKRHMRNEPQVTFSRLKACWELLNR
jgi:hypothetical protein